MAGFSATEAAFEGFRLARERPAAIGVWSGVLLVLSLVTSALLIVLAGPQLAAMAAAQPTERSDSAEVMASFGAILPAYLLIIAVSLVVYAVLYAAIYRAVLRPAEGGPGFLRFGADEVRVGLALIVVFAILFGIYLVLLLIAGILFGAAGLAAAGGGAAGGVLAFVVGLGAVLILIAGLLWAAVRLSLVLPATFNRRSLQIGSAWALTRGRFWPLLGAFALAFVLTLLVYLLALVVFTAVAAMVGGGLSATSAIFNPDFTSIGAFFTPLMIVYTLFAAVVSALGFAITAGATGAAYRDIAGVGESEVFA